jgi:hypothetical protein
MLVTSKDDAVVGFACGGSSLAVAMWTTWLMARKRTAKFMSVFVAIFLDILVLATCDLRATQGSTYSVDG